MSLVGKNSLQILLPNIKVELVAWMEGAKSFVHVGWIEDKIEGKMPDHFAVSVG